MSGDMVNQQKYLTDLSESFSRKMKELKGTMASLINSRPAPTRGLPKRKKVRSNGTENGSSSDETGTHPSTQALKSWDKMCLNLKESYTASSMQLAHILPTAIVQHRSW
jgi:hypothetical protein